MISQYPWHARSERHSRIAALLLMLLGAAVMPPALAVTTFVPFATAAVDYNTNVFAVPSNAPPFAASGNTALADTIGRFLAGATADFAWERDDLKLSAQGERFAYRRFDELTHNEYTLGALLTWHLAAIFDGDAEYSQHRYMAALADTMASELLLNTDRVSRLLGRVLISPEWRFGLQGEYHDLDTPLPDYPDFGLREKIGTATLDYLGIAKLTAGLRLEYNDGTYHDIVAATKYKQTTEQLTATYAVTGLSSFNGQLGASQRDSNFVNPADANQIPNGGSGTVGTTSSFTGALGFHRALSVKTSVDLRIFREIDSYTAGANAEIGTGLEAGAKWDPDVKLSVAVRYRYLSDEIQGNIATNDFTNRTDHTNTASAELTWKALRWLSVRPRIEYDHRVSNYEPANYNATIYSLELTARWE